MTVAKPLPELQQDGPTGLSSPPPAPEKVSHPALHRPTPGGPWAALPPQELKTHGEIVNTTPYHNTGLARVN